jgi:hypothetical protein
MSNIPLYRLGSKSKKDDAQTRNQSENAPWPTLLGWSKEVGDQGESRLTPVAFTATICRTFIECKRIQKWKST